EEEEVMNGGMSGGRGVIAGDGGEEAVAGITRPLSRRIEIQLDGGDLRRLADHAGGELIGGGRQARGFHAGLRAVPGVDTAQPDGRRARMIASAVAEGVGLKMGES